MSEFKNLGHKRERAEKTERDDKRKLIEKVLEAKEKKEAVKHIDKSQSEAIEAKKDGNSTRDHTPTGSTNKPKKEVFIMDEQGRIIDEKGNIVQIKVFNYILLYIANSKIRIKN